MARWAEWAYDQGSFRSKEFTSNLPLLFIKFDEFNAEKADALEQAHKAMGDLDTLPSDAFDEVTMDDEIVIENMFNDEL